MKHGGDSRTTATSGADGGVTLVELTVVLALLSIFTVGVLSAVNASQDAFLQNQVMSLMRQRAHNAMDRLVDMATQAVTVDAQFTALQPNTGVSSHALRFRLIQGVNPITGDPQYDDNLHVFLLGPDAGAFPAAGVVVGRGPDLATIHAAGSGADGLLGTTDDVASVVLSGDVPAVELLIPDEYAPQNGDMFTVDVTPPPIGRLLTFTLRLNARDRDGNFLFPNDVILTERVALRQ